MLKDSFQLPQTLTRKYTEHTQASLMNEHYANYSRAVGRSFVNLFFPGAQGSADPASYHYYIFTINETIADAHKLVETYFQVNNAIS